MAGLLLRGARCFGAEGVTASRDLAILNGVVVAAERLPAGAPVVDLDGRLLVPALVNAYDVLDLSTAPPLGQPPYASVYEWTRAIEEDAARLGPAFAVPLADRLFLGGVRNALSGVASVLHHQADHRALARAEFPVRVQRRYAFAHSPGLTAALRRTYRSSDRRIPWLVRAAEGAAPSLRGELDLLAAANVLRQNTVIAHGTALEPADGARLAAARTSLAWCPESDLRLYGRTAPALALRSAGVRIGLGSDGAHAGGRDLLSGLALVGRITSLAAAERLSLATRESAEVARLPLGGCDVGDPADLLATASLEALVAGERPAVALLLVRGEAVFGETPLVAAAGRPGARPPLELRVDGAPRALAAFVGRRFASLRRERAAASAALWLAGVEL